MQELSPEMKALALERLRRKTPAEKLQGMLDLNAFVRDTQLAAIRQDHPDADEFEIRMRLASRWARNLDLLKDAFGWDVAEKGY